MNIQDIILLVILAACVLIAISAVFKGRKGCCSSGCHTCHGCSDCKLCQTSGDNIHKRNE